ncbi:MAG: hypothetical protein ACPGYV_03580 [Phycisphaeraceae bacterium]
MPEAEDDDWFTCPICGEVVRARALACPGCGADDETGWSEDAEYDGVDLPDEAFGQPPGPTRQGSPMFTAVTIGLIVVIVVVWVLA